MDYFLDKKTMTVYAYDMDDPSQVAFKNKNTNLIECELKDGKPAKFYNTDGTIDLAKEEAEELEIKIATARAKRDKYLADTDKCMRSDFPIAAEKRAKIVEYSQYLRDIPQAENFPDVEIKTLSEFEEA